MNVDFDRVEALPWVRRDLLQHPRGWKWGSHTSQYQPTSQGRKPYHLTPTISNPPASLCPFSYVGQVAKIMPSFSRSARVNFAAFPTTRSALANENMHIFRDETASDPS